MFEIVFLVLAVGLMTLAWWWLKRRRAELLGEGDPSDRAGSPAEPQTLTRDTLTSRPREFDPSAWDDSPDVSGATPKPAPSRPAPSRPAAPRPPDDAEDAAPIYFDREFLERQRRQRAADHEADAPPSDE